MSTPQQIRDEGKIRMLEEEIVALKKRLDSKHADWLDNVFDAQRERSAMHHRYRMNNLEQEGRASDAHFRHRREMDEEISHGEKAKAEMRAEIAMGRKERIEQEDRHCREMSKILCEANDERKQLQERIVDLEKKITGFTEAKMESDTYLFKTMAIILIETNANVQIDRESSEIGQQQRALISSFYSIEANLEDEGQVREKVSEFENLLNELLKALCRTTSIPADERLDVRSSLQDIERAVFIFHSALSSNSAIHRSQSFDLLRSAVSMMPIVQSDHTKKHIERGLNELCALMYPGKAKSEVQLPYRPALPAITTVSFDTRSLEREIEASRKAMNDFFSYQQKYNDLSREYEQKWQSQADKEEQKRAAKLQASKRESEEKQRKHDEEMERLKREHEESNRAYEESRRKSKEAHQQECEEIKRKSEEVMRGLQK